MLQTQIKNDMVKAWKAGELQVKSVLSLLLGKIKNKCIDNKVEELPDADVLALIQKFLKELEDERNSFAKVGRAEKVDELMFQINVVQDYLPQRLSEDQIRIEISKLDDKSMKAIMTYFKNNYSGQVDMSLVSKIARGA